MDSKNDAKSWVRRPEGRDPSSLYYTVTQVAALRGCTKECVRAAVMEHRLPAWSLGGIYLIPRAVAEDWALRKPGFDDKGRRVKYRDKRIRKLQQAAAEGSYEMGDILPIARRPHARVHQPDPVSETE